MESKGKSSLELLRALDEIIPEKLLECDKEELLGFFIISKNLLVLNKLALLFSDSRYHQAVPAIIKKIFDKDLENYTGTLIYSLEDLNSADYLPKIIRMLSFDSYESRYMAFEVIHAHLDEFPLGKLKYCLKILNLAKKHSAKKILDNTSSMHFIEEVAI